ncbi:hypothetical protein M9H77_11132 [Catharanthus roseus]|uniref:Uncharacterized protein n=1 Tax=Catharanthus roseus TaxID=4058 RepID=A0ACC0BDR5_CATRO|nr:hypothetical protein M9H77_11132 [Catharanthus roseus]
MTLVWFHLTYAQHIPDECDTRLDLHRIQLRGSGHTYLATQHAINVEVWHQWRLRVMDGSALAVEVLSYPNDDGDTGTTFISVTDGCFCEESADYHSETFPVQPSHRRPREIVPDRCAHRIKRGARRQPGRGAGGGHPPVPPFPSRHGHADLRHVEVERGEGSGEVERGKGSGGGRPHVDPFDSPNLDIPSFSLGLTPPSQSLPGGSRTLRAPPPSAGSSTPHQPISQASSSDEEERTDDTDDIQHLGFRHRVGKKDNEVHAI